MSWFVIPETKRNTLTDNEKIAYDILNTAFEDADTTGETLVLANILKNVTNDTVKKLITDQFLLTYPKSPEAQAAKGALAPAAGGRRARKAKTRKTKKSKRSRGTRRS
jgi:hypothetical protein